MTAEARMTGGGCVRTPVNAQLAAGAMQVQMV